MGHIDSFARIIDRWSDVKAFAQDIGVSKKHADGMRLRNSIPPGYWWDLVLRADKRGYDEITHELVCWLGRHREGAVATKRRRLRARTGPRRRPR